MDHKAETSKDRTGIFTDKIFQITEETGEEIKKWIESGAKVIEIKEAAKTPIIDQKKLEHAKKTPLHQSPEEIKAILEGEEVPLFDEDDVIDADVAHGTIEEYVIDTGGPKLVGKKLPELTQEQVSNLISFLIRKEKLDEKQKVLLFQAKRYMGLK